MALLDMSHGKRERREVVATGSTGGNADQLSLARWRARYKACAQYLNNFAGMLYVVGPGQYLCRQSPHSSPTYTDRHCSMASQLTKR